MTPRDLAELVRLPAALTVPGDVFAGAAAAGWPLRARTLALPVASTCLYWAGMTLNDFADRHLDRVERPERPIPSGRVAPWQAFALATGLTGAGVGLAGLAGGRPALNVAVPLAATVWAYDLVAKQTVAGPPVMAAARGLDVLLGAGGRWRDAALPVAAVATHTVAVTGLSRGEVHGAQRSAGLLAAAGTVAAAGIASLPPKQPRQQLGTPQQTEQTWGTPVSPEQQRGTPHPTKLQWGSPQRIGRVIAGAYAATVGARQLAAARRPDASTVRTATGAGVRGIILLQGALAARKGALGVAAATIAAGPVAKLASRVVSPT